MTPAKTQPQILLLDDFDLIQNLGHRVAEKNDIPIEVIGTTNQLIAQLRDNPNLRFFIINNQVPDENGEVRGMIEENVARILDHSNSAVIFAMGIGITGEQMDFLQSNGIQYIRKTEINDIVRSIKARLTEESTT